MKLSIVSTLYQSENNIEEFYERASNAARELAGEQFEIVFVNDGSPDRSLEKAIAISKRDPHVVIVDLSRNFGHHRAIMTGLKFARGEIIFLLDSDLEEDPGWLLAFDQSMRSEGCDVVFGVQERRKGRWFERLSGHLFWVLINKLSNLSLHSNIVTARLMSRRYVEALLLHEEREVFLAGLWAITGFEQRAVAINKKHSGTSTYTISRKVALLVNSITSFSNLPLVWIFYLGGFILLMACLYAAYLVMRWTFFEQPLLGWTSVMASIWLLGGVIVSSIGLIGIYLAKLFSETKRRPYSIVRKIYGRN